MNSYTSKTLDLAIDGRKISLSALTLAEIQKVQQNEEEAKEKKTSLPEYATSTAEIIAKHVVNGDLENGLLALNISSWNFVWSQLLKFSLVVGGSGEEQPATDAAPTGQASTA